MEQRRLEVKALAPAGFTVLIQPPFIVAGDESAAKVGERAELIVSWAVDRLKRDFFEKDPDEIIAIWLFKDHWSYATNTRRLFRAETARQFATVQDSGFSSRALGWDTPTGENSAGTRLKRPAYGHTGFTGTSIWIDPVRGVFVVLLTNRVNPTRERVGIAGVRVRVVDAVVGRTSLR